MYWDKILNQLWISGAQRRRLNCNTHLLIEELSCL